LFGFSFDLEVNSVGFNQLPLRDHGYWAHGVLLCTHLQVWLIHMSGWLQSTNSGHSSTDDDAYQNGPCPT